MALKPKEKDTAGNGIRLQDLFLLGLNKWPWIVLSIIVCVSLAFVYLLTTQPTYTRSASIRIKDDTKGKAISSDMGGFTDLGFFQMNTNVLDEISSLESSGFMYEVARELGLDVNYTTDGKYHREILYGSALPVKVEFLDLGENQSASLEVAVVPDKGVELSNFEFDDILTEGPLTVNLGDTVDSPVGRIVVMPTANFDPKERYAIAVAKTSLKSAVLGSKSRLKVTLKNEKGNVINLSYVDKSIERAEDVLNGLIDVYNKNWVEDKNQIAVSTSRFINERLAVIESELGNVDHDISSYKSEHLIPDVNQASSLYMEQSKQTSDQLISLGAQLQMSDYIKEYLSEDANNTRAFPGNVGIQNANIENQINQYNSRLLERNSIAANSSSRNPVVADMDKQLESLRQAILSAVDNHIMSLKTQISNLEKSERKTISRIAANPSQARYLLSVERQQKVKEALYLFLLQKREENELSQAFTAYNTRIIDLPEGSNEPTSPVKKSVLFLAFIVGILLPFVVIYIREINNTKVRGRKDLQNSKIPFLGEIPLDKNHKGDNSRIVVAEGNRDIMNEAFRVLRTNLGFMSAGDTGGSVIMVTSFNPSSGKTFLTMNIGISLAIRKKKVLIIDGDLRRGSLSTYVSSPKEGLSNYLIGAVSDVNDVIVKDTIHSGLSVLPIGSIPPNPTELLESSRFTQLIADFRKEYDIIFIDCPPIEMMADAQIIEAVSDRTIFVVRAGLLERSMLPELERIYEEKKFKNMSLILNGTLNEDHRYGYKYGYGYGYGGYGYSDKRKK